MNFLAHRGIWDCREEKNSVKALEKAFLRNIGIETDVRDFGGQLVISHDPPLKSNLLLLDDLLRMYVSSETKPTLALNIKSDGIQRLLLDSILAFSVDNYFVFDMSLPDTLGYVKLHLPIAVRLSEYEVENKLIDDAAWVWLDCFEGNWFSEDYVVQLLSRGKRVAVVSPELHGRDPRSAWEIMRRLGPYPDLYLCTDLVYQATEFFNE